MRWRAPQWKPRPVAEAQQVERVEQVEQYDSVNNPQHYVTHPSGVECIEITEHMGYLLGNVIKYVWRADIKGEALEDLKKARFYLDREIALREGTT